MLTKMKIAIVLVGSLLCGVAAAQPAPNTDRKADIQAKRQAKRQAKKAAMLQKFDTNKNGALDPAERTAMHETRVLTRFKKLDTDGNGVLSLAEFKAGKAGKMGKRGKGHARRHMNRQRGIGGPRK